MSTLYIRHPPRAVAEAALTPQPCRFALVSKRGAVEREGQSALSGLAASIRQAARVVLLLAASDVSLLRVKVPPLSGARLKAALPNLVEDQLLSDPSECVFAAGAPQDGMRTVAVVDRAWLEQLSATLTALGARQLVALPVQLCLPQQAPALTAAVTDYAAERDVALRYSEQDGIGFCIGAIDDDPARAVIDALRLLAPRTALTVQVAPASMAAYQQAAAAADDATLPPLQIVAEDWSRCAAVSRNVTLDLMAGLGASAGPQLNWRPWRWPTALALLVLLVQIAGLNASWLQLRREAHVLHDGMAQTFRTAFPKERVVIDPLAQMQQKIHAARAGAQATPDDFLALASGFGSAWAGLTPGAAISAAKPAAIAALEYRERSLIVRITPANAVAADSMRAALAAHQLALTEQSAGVWQIRSAR